MLKMYVYWGSEEIMFCEMKGYFSSLIPNIGDTILANYIYYRVKNRVFEIKHNDQVTYKLYVEQLGESLD